MATMIVTGGTIADRIKSNKGILFEIRILSGDRTAGRRFAENEMTTNERVRRFSSRLAPVSKRRTAISRNGRKPARKQKPEALKMRKRLANRAAEPKSNNHILGAQG